MTTESEHQTLLVKIAIAAVWVDNQLEPAEVEYLQHTFSQQGLITAAELETVLQQPVSSAQLNLWLVAYLRNSNKIERQQMLATIANLFMADGTVSNEEHQFLDEFYELMAQIPPQPEQAAQDVLINLGRSLSQAVQQFMYTARQAVQRDTEA
ncbi:MAG: TerB family tellurite resistance protein [Cyanobacteria bacterium P01_H01_bin.121]